MSSKGWEVKMLHAPAGTRAHPSARQDEKRSRALIVGLVAAVLLGAGLFDALGARPANSESGPGATAQALDSASVVPVSGAQSSAWFCLGGSGSGSTPSVTIELTNPTGRSVSGTVTALAPGGLATSEPVRVPARSQVGVSPQPPGGGAWVAATVLLHGGGVGASEVLSDPVGWSTQACASSTSTQWYFAHGSTQGGAGLALLLYNPQATDAVVDVALESSSTGLDEPPAYQGIGVPSGGFVVEYIGEHVLDNPSVGTYVSTSSGSVVAEELQYTPLPGAGGGASLLLGVPSPSTSWQFPATLDPAGGNVVFHIFNPSGHTVSVEVEVGLVQGQVQPFSVRVPANSVDDLVAEQQTRIPTASFYQLSFLSSGGGIVVDREMSSSAMATAPQVGQVHGVPAGATAYLVPAVTAPGTGALSLAVSDLSSSPAKVTLEDAADSSALPGFSGVLVSPGHPLVVSPPPGSPIGNVQLLVLSSEPVAVEVDAAPAGAIGTVVLPALSLP